MGASKSLTLLRISCRSGLVTSCMYALLGSLVTASGVYKGHDQITFPTDVVHML